jgi:dipeptidyl aminopeptidase/acylaminoacyl peptidase
MIEVLQERYTNVYRVPRLTWQPDGTMLAISDDVGPNPAVLRVFDMATGDLRALSMFPVGYSGIQWAPDGTSIAVLTGTGALIVVDLDGTWLLRRETDWKQLLGWEADA